MESQQTHMMKEVKDMKCVLDATREATAINRREIEWMNDRLQRVEGDLEKID